MSRASARCLGLGMSRVRYLGIGMGLVLDV